MTVYIVLVAVLYGGNSVTPNYTWSTALRICRRLFRWCCYLVEYRVDSTADE